LQAEVEDLEKEKDILTIKTKKSEEKLEKGDLAGHHLAKQRKKVLFVFVIFLFLFIFLF
jgi:hypothetical protein